VVLMLKFYRHRLILHLVNIVVQFLGLKVMKKTFMFLQKINIQSALWVYSQVVVMLKVIRNHLFDYCEPFLRIAFVVYA
jgi:hypothetical protein